MTVKQQFILSAIGRDQVGLVEKLSQFISSHGCNIEDSKMAVFCGEFAVIILISGSENNMSRIAENYRRVEKETGLSLTIRIPTERKRADFFIKYRLAASCMDHPGIVYQISGTLSSFSINIEFMETKTYFAPESGTPLFRLEATLAVPFETDIDAVLSRFAQIQREQNIDIDFTPH